MLAQIRQGTSPPLPSTRGRCGSCTLPEHRGPHQPLGLGREGFSLLTGLWASLSHLVHHLQLSHSFLSFDGPG